MNEWPRVSAGDERAVRAERGAGACGVDEGDVDEREAEEDRSPGRRLAGLDIARCAAASDRG